MHGKVFTACFLNGIQVKLHEMDAFIFIFLRNQKKHARERKNISVLGGRTKGRSEVGFGESRERLVPYLFLTTIF